MPTEYKNEINVISKIEEYVNNIGENNDLSKTIYIIYFIFRTLSNSFEVEFDIADDGSVKHSAEGISLKKNVKFKGLKSSKFEENQYNSILNIFSKINNSLKDNTEKLKKSLDSEVDRFCQFVINNSRYINTAKYFNESDLESGSFRIDVDDVRNTIAFESFIPLEKKYIEVVNKALNKLQISNESTDLVPLKTETNYLNENIIISDFEKLEGEIERYKDHHAIKVNKDKNAIDKFNRQQRKNATAYINLIAKFNSKETIDVPGKGEKPESAISLNVHLQNFKGEIEASQEVNLLNNGIIELAELIQKNPRFKFAIDLFFSAVKGEISSQMAIFNFVFFTYLDKYTCKNGIPLYTNILKPLYDKTVNTYINCSSFFKKNESTTSTVKKTESNLNNSNTYLMTKKNN